MLGSNFTAFTATEVLRCACLVLLDETLVLGCTGRIIEGAREQLEFVFLHEVGFGIFTEWFIFGFVSNCGLTALLEFGDVLRLLMLLVDTVFFIVIELCIDVGAQVLLL